MGARSASIFRPIAPLPRVKILNNDHIDRLSGRVCRIFAGSVNGKVWADRFGYSGR
jgi:hypothetical protein